MLTQQQYMVLQKPIRHLDIKIELLNINDVVIDTLEGYALSGNINMQADSAYRRSGSLTMAIHNNNLIPKPDSKIWFNKKIRINIGLRDWNDNIVWFNQGIFVIQKAKLSKSQSEHTIDIDYSDLMSNLDGSNNGNLTNEVKIVAQGVKVSDALRSTLSQLGKVSIDNIIVNDVDALVPYEINVEPNSTVYELAKTLLDLYMGLEMMYDENGYLVVQKIKDRRNDPVLWDFTKNGMDLTLNYSNDIDFTNIRNSIKIWGMKKNTGETVKWTYKNKYVRKTIIERNSITDKAIGDICYVEENKTSYYWNSSWIAFVDVIFNPEFSIDRIGLKEYAYNDEKIATVEQGQLRAEYELRTRSNLAETISLSCVSLYGLNVNSKIKVLLPESGIDGDYLVKSVSIPLSYNGEMNIDATKLYY